LGRKAAVKVLLPEHSRNQDLIDRFFNEAKTASSLKHPALVDVFDFGIHADGSAYLVMDFLEGESLGARLARVAPLPNEAAIDVARQIARGMEAAHNRGIVHRDLKPDNVFLIPDPEDPTRDRVKILDFGIAKLLGTPKGSKGATSTGMVLGTPLFMAPEQCRGAGVVDHRADIYSLGCILYFMLCARPPFNYEGVGEILGAHLHEPVAPPTTINPTVPAGLEAIVMKALAKKPEERYQSMSAMAAELARLLGQTGSNRPMTFPPSTIALPATTAPTTLSKAAAPLATPVATPARRSSVIVPLAVAFGAGAAVTAVAVFWPRAHHAPAPPAVSSARPEPPKSALPQPTPAPRPAAAPDAAAIAAVTRPVERPTPPAQDPRPEPTQKAPKAPPRPRHEDDDYTRGMASLARGDERAALESFRAYLRGPEPPPARRAEVERHMIDLQRKFGEIEVSCDLAGADVFVDGRPVGRTPLPRSILLAGGAHELVLSKDGYKTARKTFSLSPGQRQPFFFHLPR
jgi:serine/threonine-protein kinase